MLTLRQGTDITHHHFRTENHIGSEFITCNMGHSSKSSGQGQDKGMRRLRGTDSKVWDTGTHV